MKKFLFVIFIAFSQIAISQDKGTLKGLLTDKEANNETLPFANVFLKGTNIGATTDFDGNYSFQVPTGTHIVSFSFLGYKTVEKTFTIVASQTVVLNQIMSAEEGVALDEIVIKSSTSKESASALLLEQKKAVVLKTTIGAEELSKKGVSNVAAAVTKASGVSKQEGGAGTIFVRGLGDRYNFTTLNGLPLPSNNPSFKNINLDIFSTDIVEVVDISKTYSANQYGDFSGASININSKEHRGSSKLKIKVGSGVNANASKNSKFLKQDGTDYFGFSNNKIPKNVLSGYNYDTNLNGNSINQPVNSNFSILGGKRFDLEGDKSLSIFTTLSFESDYSYKEGVARGGVNTQGLANQDLFLESYGYNTNTTGMANVSFVVNNANKLYYNVLFINSTTQNVEDYKGLLNVFDATGENFIRRATFERTVLLVNQFLGKHDLKDNLDLTWGLSFNRINNVIPDRQQTTLFDPAANEENQGKRLIASSSLSTADTHRYFQDLNEDELAGNIEAVLDFSKDEEESFRGKVSLGYNGRIKNVNFEATQINTNIINETDVSPDDLDSFFNSQRFNAGDFQLLTFRSGQADPLKPQLYIGEQFINAVYSNLEYKFSKKLQMLVGVRGEAINQFIDYDTSVDVGNNKLEEFQILPSLALKYSPNESSNIKFAASKTFTLPQFKERAPFQYVEVTQIKIGNQFLKSSTDYNLDLGFEYFPEKLGVVSFTTFGKFIQDPINEFVKASATNDITFANTGQLATVFGAEFELKLNVLPLFNKDADDKDEKFSFGLNASFMQTNQDLDEDKVRNENPGISADFTDKEQRLTGASDWLANADITYFKEFKENLNVQATVTFNYASDRIYALGTNNRGNLVDSQTNSLDFIFKSTISKNLEVGFSVKNILNPTIERIQETQNVVVNSYSRGVNSGLSLSYKF